MKLLLIIGIIVLAVSVLAVVITIIKFRSPKRREGFVNNTNPTASGKGKYRIDLRPPYDKQIKVRRRKMRLMNFIISSIVIFGVPIFLMSYIGELLGMKTVGLFVGFFIGGIIEACIAPNRMFIYNPEWTAYVTQDAIFGTMVPYGPGFHFSHWWEERNKGGNYSLKVISRPLEVPIPTQTAQVTISGEFEYAINLAYIDRAIGVDETTIENGITAFIESSLIEFCDEKPAEEARKGIDELNESLSKEFMAEEGTGGGNLTVLSNKYGFTTVGVVIKKITLPKEVQDTRNAVDEATKLFEVVASLFGYTVDDLKKKIESKEVNKEEFMQMLNRAMIVSGNASTMNVNVIEGNAAAVAAQLLQKVTGGGK